MINELLTYLFTVLSEELSLVFGDVKNFYRHRLGEEHGYKGRKPTVLRYVRFARMALKVDTLFDLNTSQKMLASCRTAVSAAKRLGTLLAACGQTLIPTIVDHNREFYR
jgi:hypothetical protein